MTKKKSPTEIDGAKREVQITPPNKKQVHILVQGIDGPLIVNAFPHKAIVQLAEQQAQGQQKAKTKKGPKDFEACFQAARHITAEGRDGIACAAFRKAMITAAGLAGFHMTKARLIIKVLADGYDREDGMPLVHIIGGEPERDIRPVRVGMNKVDIRIRPKWREWRALLRIEYDADILNDTDIANIVLRAGQCGVCEGRASSPSGGQGWGYFEIVQDQAKAS